MCQLADNLRNVVIVDEKGHAPHDIAEEYAQKFGNGNLRGHDTVEWYNVLRNLQGVGYYKAVTGGMLKHMPENIDFIRDSLFCEYAYVMDLDKMVLELYRGWQKTMPENSPFEWLPGEEYAPCAKIGEMPLAEIVDADQAHEALLQFYRDPDADDEAEE